MRSRTLDMPNIPTFLRRALERKENFWIMGFLNALSLFAEEKRRRAELGKSNPHLRDREKLT